MKLTKNPRIAFGGKNSPSPVFVL